MDSCHHSACPPQFDPIYHHSACPPQFDPIYHRSACPPEFPDRIILLRVACGEGYILSLQQFGSWIAKRNYCSAKLWLRFLKLGKTFFPRKGTKIAKHIHMRNSRKKTKARGDGEGKGKSKSTVGFSHTFPAAFEQSDRKGMRDYESSKQLLCLIELP